MPLCVALSGPCFRFPPLSFFLLSPLIKLNEIPVLRQFQCPNNAPKAQ
jgi:hypothetical protein